MPLIIDGVTFENGAPLLVGGVQAQNVMCNGVEVWVNNYVADAPTSFVASDGEVEVINFSWTLPPDQGVPQCTYSIRTVGGTEVATAGVGETTANLSGVTSDTYIVVAVNIAGESIDSNTDAGSSVPPFNAVWSGDSTYDTGSIMGIQVSGSTFRYAGQNESAGQDYGDWATANLDGTFSNTDSYTIATFGSKRGFYSGVLGESTASNHIAIQDSRYTTVGEVSFDKVAGFSGNSFDGSWDEIETSGGQLRWKNSDTAYGDWITLT